MRQFCCIPFVLFVTENIVLAVILIILDSYPGEIIDSYLPDITLHNYFVMIPLPASYVYLSEEVDYGPKQLYQQYQPSTYQYINFLVQNKELAEDLTQETFYKCFKNIETFPQDAEINTWLHLIARNLATQIGGLEQWIYKRVYVM